MTMWQGLWQGAQTVQDGARDGGDRHGIVTAHGLLINCSSSLNHLYAVVHRQRDPIKNTRISSSRCSPSAATCTSCLQGAKLAVEGELVAGVAELRCRYLDSFPPREALRIFKGGFLFCAAEFANHCFSQFQSR
jgi:hypothetical protein